MKSVDKAKQNQEVNRALACHFTGFERSKYNATMWLLCEQYADKWTQVDICNPVYRGWFICSVSKIEEEFVNAIRYDKRGHWMLKIGDPRTREISYADQASIRKVFLQKVGEILNVAPPKMIVA